MHLKYHHTMISLVFWGMTPCRLVCRHCVWGACCLFLHGSPRSQMWSWRQQGAYVPIIHTTSYPRRLESVSVPLWEPQMYVIRHCSALAGYFFLQRFGIPWNRVHHVCYISTGEQHFRSCHFVSWYRKWYFDMLALRYELLMYTNVHL